MDTDPIKDAQRRAADYNTQTSRSTPEGEETTMAVKTSPPNEAVAASCKLLVECTEEEELFRARKLHNRFCAWKGRDFWHKEISVQVRLERDGSVFLSTQEGHVSTLRIAAITIEQLHELIRGVTANAAHQPNHT